MKLATTILRYLVILALPFLIIISAIRLMISPLFLNFEYNRAGFPADPYGLSLEERLKWSKTSVDYLVNDTGIEFLADQSLAPGTPLYNERELSHMLDVKKLVQTAIMAWYLLIAFFLLVTILAGKYFAYPDYWRALAAGGWVTIALLGAVFLAVFLSFDALFTAFHHLFFTGDTWLFAYSDTLIRLFPMQFWQDAFIAVGIFSGFFSLLFIILGKVRGRV